MNNKFPIRIFGLYDPCFSDIKLIQLDIAYKKSECYKIIMHEQVVYLREKWNYMRKFFEAESLIDDIEKVNDDFRYKWGLQQRKIYYDKNADRIRKQQMDFYYKNRETILEQESNHNQLKGLISVMVSYLRLIIKLTSRKPSYKLNKINI